MIQSKIIFIIIFQFILVSIYAQKNDSADYIPPSIIEPMPYYYDGGDTLFINQKNNTDTLSGKIWINLLLDSLGNKLSFNIIAYDNYNTGKREVCNKYNAFDFYEKKMNYLDIYPKEIIMTYTYVEKYIKEIRIEDTKQSKTEEYYNLRFYFYISSYYEDHNQ